jgi:hypothetical protein
MMNQNRKMTQKMTHREHVARAMLLGRVYDWRDRTYNFTNKYDPSVLSPRDVMASDTMEIIPSDHVGKRAFELNTGWRKGMRHTDEPPEGWDAEA